jgi:hypothetical protein
MPDRGKARGPSASTDPRTSHLLLSRGSSNAERTSRRGCRERAIGQVHMSGSGGIPKDVRVKHEWLRARRDAAVDSFLATIAAVIGGLLVAPRGGGAAGVEATLVAAAVLFALAVAVGGPDRSLDEARLLLSRESGDRRIRPTSDGLRREAVHGSAQAPSSFGGGSRGPPAPVRGFLLLGVASRSYAQSGVAGGAKM